jgi:hypothetical protein
MHRGTSPAATTPPSPRLATGLDPVVACLLPANASEAALGTQYVAANVQALDCLRLAREPGLDPGFALKCRAQSVSMMRQALSAMRMLLRVQAVRQSIEADGAATDRAAWTEHCAVGLMAQALPGTPPPAMLQPPTPPVRPEPQPVPESEPEIDLLAMVAEQYAVIYPDRAALIRQLGRVPDNVSFGPPDDDLVRALVTGRTPALLALDRKPAHARAV